MDLGVDGKAFVGGANRGLGGRFVGNSMRLISAASVASVIGKGEKPSDSAVSQPG